MFLRPYAKWIDGGQNALEMGRLEASSIAPGSAATAPKKGR
jgi:integrase